jgi:uncharacterized membrane protein YgcG
MSKYIGFAFVLIALVSNLSYPGKYSQVIIIGVVSCVLIAWLKEIMVSQSLGKRLTGSEKKARDLADAFDLLQVKLNNEKERSSALYVQLGNAFRDTPRYTEAQRQEAAASAAVDRLKPMSTREALKTPVPPPRASESLRGYSENRVRREDRQPDSSNYPMHHHDNSGMGIGDVALVALAVNAFSDLNSSRSTSESSYSEPSRSYSDTGSSCSPSDSGSSDSGGGGGSSD